jgi:hypothetical protein
MSYLLLYHDIYEKIWIGSGGIYDSEKEAEEDRDFILDNTPGMEKENFVIILNDGKAIRNYRPLDLGDRILYR